MEKNINDFLKRYELRIDDVYELQALGSNLYINFKNENEYDEFYDNIMTKTTFSF